MVVRLFSSRLLLRSVLIFAHRVCDRDLLQLMKGSLQIFFRWASDHPPSQSGILPDATESCQIILGALDFAPLVLCTQREASCQSWTARFAGHSPRLQKAAAATAFVIRTDHASRFRILDSQNDFSRPERLLRPGNPRDL